MIYLDQHRAQSKNVEYHMMITRDELFIGTGEIE